MKRHNTNPEKFKWNRDQSQVGPSAVNYLGSKLKRVNSQNRRRESLQTYVLTEKSREVMMISESGTVEAMLRGAAAFNPFGPPAAMPEQHQRVSDSLFLLLGW